MSIKQFITVGGITAVVATAGFAYIAPHDSPAEVQQQRQEQQVHDLSDNEKKVHAQMRQDGRDLMDAVNQDKLRPVEPRSLDPDLKPKFEIPLP